MKDSTTFSVFFDVDAADLKLRLQRFISNNEEVNAYEDGNSSTHAMRILHRGVEYQLAVGNAPSDLMDFEKIFCSNELPRPLAALSLSLGQNVEGGQFVPPIVSDLLQFAATLSTKLGGFAVAWMPARLLSDSKYFSTTVEAYANGGAFPVLSTVKLAFHDGYLLTAGLSWFSGQELKLCGDGMPQSELMRRAVRIVHDIATNGPILLSQTVPDIDRNKMVRLSLSADADLVTAEIVSSLEQLTA